MWWRGLMDFKRLVAQFIFVLHDEHEDDEDEHDDEDQDADEDEETE